jgi:hypothetical protein
MLLYIFSQSTAAIQETVGIIVQQLRNLRHRLVVEL